MTTLTQQPVTAVQTKKRVTPSRVEAPNSPFTLTQKLEPFAKWCSESIWVPPKASSTEFAKTMLRENGLLASKSQCWSCVEEEHRSSFQQVREIDLFKDSIRLPKGKLFVSVTEQDRFDEITDAIPNCVRSRLEEFMEGPGKRNGVKVYYLKPLCVERDDDLIFTTRESIMAAITLVQNETFSAYRRMYIQHRPMRAMLSALNSGLSIPRKMIVDHYQRKQREVDAYEARLEFNRRKGALRACNLHRRYRTDGCTFDEMLALTNPPDRDDVIEQYGIEKKLSQAQRDRLKMAAIQSIPWFVALSLGDSYAASYAASLTITVAPPLMVCDPAFVAEMPGSRGVLLKIGHFDEVRGVTHIEI